MSCLRRTYGYFRTLNTLVKINDAYKLHSPHHLVKVRRGVGFCGPKTGPNDIIASYLNKVYRERGHANEGASDVKPLSRLPRIRELLQTDTEAACKGDPVSARKK
jgi:hypothetical protein